METTTINGRTVYTRELNMPNAGSIIRLLMTTFSDEQQQTIRENYSSEESRAFLAEGLCPYLHYIVENRFIVNTITGIWDLKLIASEFDDISFYEDFYFRIKPEHVGKIIYAAPSFTPFSLGILSDFEDSIYISQKDKEKELDNIKMSKQTIYYLNGMSLYDDELSLHDYFNDPDKDILRICHVSKTIRTPDNANKIINFEEPFFKIIDPNIFFPKKFDAKNLLPNNTII